MFRNYVKSTLRNLHKHKGYSLLNIFGLAIGMACAGIIFLWVEQETHYNDYLANKAHLYQVMENWHYTDNTATYTSTSGELAGAMKAEIPGIAGACRATEGQESLLFNAGDHPVKAGGKYADASIFQLFTLPFIEGNPQTAFAQLHSIVLTETTARNIFGRSQGLVGKMVKVNNETAYQVSGVIKDIPKNSSLRFEWVAPFAIALANNHWLQNWQSFSVSTYVLLHPNTDLIALNKQLHHFVHQHNVEMNTDEFLLPVKDWHLRDNFENGVQTGGRIVYVRLFSIIAWIILLLACINFMNLATARGQQRAKEVGVKKVLGASLQSLRKQFLGEAIVLSCLAAIVAVLLMALLLPVFNGIMNKELTLGFTNPSHWLALIATTLTCGLIAGSYPAFYLTRFNPVAVFKGGRVQSGSAPFVRKGLVVFQFTVSITLIIFTVIIYQQIQFVKQRDLGYNKERLLMIDVEGNMSKHMPAIKQSLLNTGMVTNAATANTQMIWGGNNTDAFQWEGKPADQKVLVSRRNVSHDFFDTYGLHLTEGRAFHPEAAGDSASVIITASFAKLMSSHGATGRQLISDDDDGKPKAYQVVGVVNDFVYGDMYGKPDPVVFFNRPEDATELYLRIKPGAATTAALQSIEAVMKAENPDYPFAYSFVDDQFNDVFSTETLLAKLSRIFTVLAILISCLGLFGLAAYTAEMRTREIGIRKVLGAGVANVTGLLTRDFLRLTGIAALLAFPLGWWSVSAWLQNYAYRVHIQWWVFAAAGILALLITTLTVGFHAIKTSLTNPVQTLRAE